MKVAKVVDGVDREGGSTVGSVGRVCWRGGHGCAQKDKWLYDNCIGHMKPTIFNNSLRNNAYEWNENRVVYSVHSD